MSERHVRWGLVLVACTIALSGCSGNAYPIFDREATDADAMPDDLASFVGDDFDIDSFRLSASYGDADLYLVKTTEGIPCLGIAAGSRSTISCAAGGLLGAGSAGVGSFEMGPAPIGERDGWTVLSDNIRVSDSGVDAGP